MGPSQGPWTSQVNNGREFHYHPFKFKARLKILTSYRSSAFRSVLCLMQCFKYIFSTADFSSSVIRVFLLLIIMWHFRSGVVITTFDIKWLIFSIAIKNGLVATQILGDRINGLNHFQAKTLFLMVFLYRYFFNMTTEATVVDTRVMISTISSI